MAVIAQAMGDLTVGKAAAGGMRWPCTPLLAASSTQLAIDRPVIALGSCGIRDNRHGADLHLVGNVGQSGIAG